VEKRSVRRHLAELEGVGLITRQERPGKPSLLIIEDPSEKETESYLRNFAGPGEDKIVLPTPDKIVRPYKKEEREERQNLVNEEQALSEAGESGQDRRSLPSARQPTQIPKAKRDYLAQEMIDVLRDEHSLGFYRKVAARCPPQIIFEALSVVKQAARDGAIRKTRGALFATLIKESARPPKSVESSLVGPGFRDARKSPKGWLQNYTPVASKIGGMVAL
jgi:hypothetical protein